MVPLSFIFYFPFGFFFDIITISITVVLITYLLKSSFFSPGDYICCLFRCMVHAPLLHLQENRHPSINIILQENHHPSINILLKKYLVTENRIMKHVATHQDVEMNLWQ